MTSGNPSSSASSPPPQRMEFKITSHPSNLRHVRKQVEEFAQSAGMPTEFADAVGLALNEALANIIRHGYEGATNKPIIVTVERGEREFRVTIRDWAKPFDPSKLKPRPRDELAPGGIGMTCIKQLMDDVKFERLPDGMLLRMIKKTAKDVGR
jgi:anti-sigma regulatory factor (Ser/Thr protein kinase)